MKKLLLPVLLLVMASCHSNPQPADVLDPQTMASLLSEAYMLEGFYAIETEYRYDTMLPEVLAAYDDILARHHTSRQAVERSFTYYAAHPLQYKTIQDSVFAILNRTGEALPDTLPESDIKLEVLK